ncbi:MAG: response regulator [Deltaproteobacteria bacterium]|nr:response regulator [Deltaproteobacteria bacterium]
MSLRVLVVDDDPWSLHIARRVLEGHGFAVETAEDLAGALRLLDLAHPEGTGSPGGTCSPDGTCPPGGTCSPGVPLALPEGTGSPAFDAALLDIHFPGGGGEVLLREIRARRAAMPVVAVTASAMSGDRERFLRLGFTAYLSKPIDVQTFAATIERIVTSGGAA